MEQVLVTFHSKKQWIIDLGAWRGMKAPIKNFKIPKLELMASFAHQMKANSALIQYTVDVLECLLITQCKTTFQHTVLVNWPEPLQTKSWGYSTARRPCSCSISTWFCGWQTAW